MPDSFYDIKGNEVSKEGIVADFINNYTGNLTDFNEGSEIRNLLEAFAVYAMGNEERINDILYVMDILNADGEYLDLMASQPGINMERHTGTEAQGSVIFSVANVLVEDLLVPAGTIVTSDTGVDFETVTDNILLPGQTSMPCAVRAIEVGSDGNIPAGSIVTKIDGYDAVGGFTLENIEAFIGGTDFEEDDAFRDRIVARMRLQKFGSKPYYVATLRQEFSDAHDIFFDPTATGYTASIMPNTYKGAAAQAKLEADIADYLGNENNILLGHSFDVVTPGVKDISISIMGILDDIPSVDICKEAINKYITGGNMSDRVVSFPGLNLGQETSPADLKDMLVSTFLIENYSRVSVTVTDDGEFDTGENKYNVTSITVA